MGGGGSAAVGLLPGQHPDGHATGERESLNVREREGEQKKETQNMICKLFFFSKIFAGTKKLGGVENIPADFI